MKNLLLIVTALGVMLFTSCESKDMPPREDLQEKPEEKPEEKLTSLEGTYWKATVSAEGFVNVFEMVFTASTATYTHTDTRTDGDPWTFSGRYVFDADKQEFVMPNDAPQPYPLEEGFGIPEARGTIKGDVMTVLIPMTFDVYEGVELKMQ
jgi:hypothetical protein